jgi:hypothetical protein
LIHIGLVFSMSSRNTSLQLPIEVTIRDARLAPTHERVDQTIRLTTLDGVRSKKMQSGVRVTVSLHVRFTVTRWTVSLRDYLALNDLFERIIC